MTTDHKIGLYCDEHIARAIVFALVQKGYRAIMAVDVEMTGKDDDTEHLPYATTNRLLLVTMDKPFANRTDYLGLICLTKDLHDSIGGAVKALADFIELFDEERDAGQVHWLR